MRPTCRLALIVSNFGLHIQIERHPLNGFDPLDPGVVQQHPPDRQVEKTLHIIKVIVISPTGRWKEDVSLCHRSIKAPCMPWLMVVYPVMLSPLSPEALTASLN